MNTDVEDLLCEAMDRFTADLRAPVGLAGRVTRRRRRRMVLRSVAAVTAVLTAGAVALTAAGVPGTRRGGTGGPVVSTAYVLKHVDSALRAAGPGEIAQVTLTTRRTVAPRGTTATITSQVWSYGGQWRLVTNWPAGQSEYDLGFTGSSACTLVSYQARTWARQRGTGRPAVLVPHVPGPGSCDSLVDALSGLFPFGLRGIFSSASSRPLTVATSLRTAVSSGTLAVAGRQRVAGIEAIALASRPGSLLSETILVSPATYLPVRVAVRPNPGGPVLQQTAVITWLTPSAQNLAQLTVSIPAGFRQVPFAQAVRAGLAADPTEGK